MNNNNLQKAYESLGQDTVNEMEAMSKEDLKKRVVEASEAMRDVADKLADNPRYQQAKQAVSDLTAGKREVDKRQKAIILVALSLLSEQV